MRKLKACPFCGSYDVEIYSTLPEHIYAYCRQCGACGATSASVESAVQSWNSRSLTGEWIIADEDGLLWECPECRTQFKLEHGNPESTGLNHCPVCGAHLTLSRS